MTERARLETLLTYQQIHGRAHTPDLLEFIARCHAANTWDRDGDVVHGYCDVVDALEAGE